MCNWLAACAFAWFAAAPARAQEFLPTDVQRIEAALQETTPAEILLASPTELHLIVARPGAERQVGVLRVTTTPVAGARRTTAHWTLHLEQWSKGEGDLRALVAVAEGLAAVDGGWVERAEFPSPPAAVLATVAAIGSKVYLRRDERHVFNPSAFALAAVGLAALIAPSVAYTPLFHTMNLPPFMGEWILLAALLPQLRLPIVLITLGAVLGTVAAAPIGPGPGLFRPPTILAIALLATDPATIPRTPGGRLLYGIGFGVLMRLTSLALVTVGQPDDLAKVLPLPALNLCAGLLDRVAARIGTPRMLDVTHNRRHVAAWVLIAIIALWMEKAGQFEGALHWSYQTPGMRFEADHVPTCTQNPTYCHAFGVPGPEDLWGGG